MRARSAPSATAAAREGRAPRIVDLLDRWGGVTIAYRRRLIDAPSYTLNHEEVAKAMEEGIRFAEGLTPEAVEVDRLRPRRRPDASAPSHRRGDRQALEPSERVTLPARTILVAAGTQPNTVLAREDPVHVALDGRYFQAYDEDGQPVTPERVAKPDGGARADEPPARRPRRSASSAISIPPSPAMW